MAKFIKIFCVTGLGMMMLCLFSCEQKQEPVKPPPQVRVVKKSIDHSKRSGLDAKSVPSIQNTDTGKETAVAQSVIKEKADTAVSNKGALSAKEVPEVQNSKTASGKAQTVGQGTLTPVTETQAKTELEAVAASLVNSLGTMKYDTKGRIDPFLPLLSEQKEEPVAVKPEEIKPKRILTPLEKMDISQFKLVAVVEMKGRSVAMVEEASGKGFEVEIGTYIGRNGGRVSAITRDGIIVKEYVRDFKGTRKERIQEIKFHKSEGGE